MQHPACQIVMQRGKPLSAKHVFSTGKRPLQPFAQSPSVILLFFAKKGESSVSGFTGNSHRSSLLGEQQTGGSKTCPGTVDSVDISGVDALYKAALFSTATNKRRRTDHIMQVPRFCCMYR